MKKNLLQDEAALASGADVSSLDRSYSARVLNGDYKKAEGLAWLQDSDVQKIRSFISIGAVAEAQELLDKKPILEAEEVEFEKGRAFVFNANFTQALTVFEPLLKSGRLGPLSTMTAYQLKGLCEYELGKYPESLSSLDRVASFESVFPAAEASLFASSLRIRALSEIKAVFNIEAELKGLWQRVTSNQYIVSKRFQLIIYLLASCHLKNDVNSCLAGIQLARLMGSPIHEGIFLAYLSSLSADEKVENEVKAFGIRFPYVAHIKNKMAPPPAGLQITMPEELRDLVFLNHNTRYNFIEDKLSSIKLTLQNADLLKLIKHGPIEKESLFQAHWKLTYNPLIHDTKIRTSLKRIREQAGIEVLSNNNMLTLPFTIVI